MGRWPAQNRVGRAKRGNRTGPELQNRPANNQEQVFQGPDHRPAETFMTMTRPIAGTPICWFDRQTDRQTDKTDRQSLERSSAIRAAWASTVARSRRISASSCSRSGSDTPAFYQAAREEWWISARSARIPGPREGYLSGYDLLQRL